MRTSTVSTVLIGPSALFREGLSRILGDCGFQVVASAACVDEHVLSLPPHDSLLLVIDASSEYDGALEQIANFKNRHSAARVAVLAAHHLLDHALSSFRAGAHGYFAQVSTAEALVKSLELIMLGETILPMACLSAAAGRSDSPGAKHGNLDTARPAPAHYPLLSPQEASILECLTNGDANKVIARKLQISEATVKVHVKAILKKIRAQNRTQAAIWAMNHGPQRSGNGNRATLASGTAQDDTNIVPPDR
jgi:DNA-binding NarL/FixJ family response regulator